MLNAQRRKLLTILSGLMSRLGASGAEFLHARNADLRCRRGLPRWRESGSALARRTEQEWKLFHALDRAGLVVTLRGEAPELEAWVSRLAREGFDHDNRRVSEKGILHVFHRNKRASPLPRADDALDEAAGAIERLLEG